MYLYDIRFCERRCKMSELRFYWAKKLYEEIENLCLSKAMNSNEKCSFRIYDNISKRCYNMLMRAKKISIIIPLEKILKSELNEDDEKYVNNLNKAMYNNYYWNEKRYGKEEKNDTKRAFLEKWDDNTNAYANLQKFSSQQMIGKSVTFNDVICVYNDVLNILKESKSFEELENNINLVIAPYEECLTD